MSFPLPACFCFLALLPLLTSAQNNKNITLGSFLIAGTDSSSSWVSPSGDFAFGFQQVGNSDNFILAIWFDNIPEKTFTWSADNLVQRGSKLQLTLNGGLVLSDSTGTEIWSPIGGGAAFANMLNTGNFVVTDKNLVVLWQSFDHPTDTILPTQTLNPGTSLMAHYSASNYSSGRFKFSMQQDGSLVFHKTDGLQDLKYYSLYEETSAAGSGNQVVFDQSGLIYVRVKNGTKIVVLPDSGTTDDLYQRAILEFDGVFRRYTYPRSNSTNRLMAWSMQSFVPQDICKQIQGSTSTEGVECGFNSYCQMGDDQRPKCSCPPGYLFSDPTDQMNGCKLESVLASCEEGTPESGQFQLEELAYADFPGSDIKAYTKVSETLCRSLCLSDCSCAAAVFAGGSCWKKASPLLNGVVDPTFDGKALIKVTVDNSSGKQPPAELTVGDHHKKDHRAVIIIESVFLGSSVFLNILLLSLAVFTASFCACRKRKAEPKKSQDIPGTNMRNFSYKELQEATNGFKEVVGRGAFATVYKGVLDSEQGNIIAVKKLNELVEENQSEFESEVRAIARTGHRNLVQLIGFCNEQQHRLLVYEYMSNGALAGVLFQHQRPSWSRRMKVALETARGLNYLHEECSIQIIHCDIKPQNVLLDDSFTTRISDFGLAKLLRIDQTHTVTGIRGTKGYVAPEWFRSMPITAKVDVYSYGVLLLELVCCRRCFDANMEDESRKVLADWAYDCYEEGRVDKLVESDNEAMDDVESVKKFVLIALWCIQEDPSLRPTMKKVIQMIQGSIEEPMPPDLAPGINSMNGV